MEQLHIKGIRTFAFVGPILPGNPEKLIADLDGKADRVLIDRMNYLHAIKGFYYELGLRREMTDGFFNEFKERFITELKKRKINFEVVF